MIRWLRNFFRRKPRTDVCQCGHHKCFHSPGSICWKLLCACHTYVENEISHDKDEETEELRKMAGLR